MNRRIPCLIALFVTALFGSLALADTYRVPDLEKEIFDTEAVELDRFDRSGAVSSLVSVARDFDEEDDVDYELRAHALAIASRLDEDNDKVKSTLDQLKDNGETIGESADKSRVTRRLASAVRALSRKKDNEDNLKCAAYIADIGIRLDPKGDNADKLEKSRDELEEDGHKADWKDMLGRAIQHSRNPWEEEETVFEKKEVEMPGGKGERFAQPQSRVNGLVVRQLGNGNLAGSASTVNATALKEADVDELLFTFNQEVGPMMGGCLEEVIKFLRIRYDSEPEKIPSGYKIELGFQDKYVPKDGPSAATAFTLLLDSLFSGEELDDDFACTGDMTADGRVQRIGGAAAKIRGATKRGCKIVGIPLDNGKEIGDVLLLDGIDQLLDIQIFTLETFDEAYAVSRKEKSPEVVETLQLFNDVASVVRDGDESLLANAEVQSRLQKVVDRMPNHLSAKLLLEKGKGENPKILTVGGTINQIEITTSGTLRTIGRAVFSSKMSEDDDGDSFEFDKETTNDAKTAVEELEKLSKAIDPRLEKYHEAVLKVCKSVAEGPDDDEKAKAYGKRLEEELDSVQSTYRKMISDPEILEDMGG
ncbi:S16 family serine protease [Haloferula helveola]